MADWDDVKEQPQITREYMMDVGTRARIVRELHELIAALDRRIPQVQRAGEVDIAKAAAVLRAEAVKQIQEIQCEAPSVPSDDGKAVAR
jgi:hypothetical protein